MNFPGLPCAILSGHTFYDAKDSATAVLQLPSLLPPMKVTAFGTLVLEALLLWPHLFQLLKEYIRVQQWWWWRWQIDLYDPGITLGITPVPIPSPSCIFTGVNGHEYVIIIVVACISDRHSISVCGIKNVVDASTRPASIPLPIYNNGEILLHLCSWRHTF